MTRYFCCLVAGFFATNFAAAAEDEYDTELIVLPDDQTLYDQVSRSGVHEFVNNGLERLHLPGIGKTYYILQRESLLRGRVKNTLSNLGKHDADIIIRPSSIPNKFIHLRITGEAEADIFHLRFENDFLIHQTTEVAKYGEFPGENEFVEYFEYGYDTEFCHELSSEFGNITDELANTLKTVGSRPKSGTMRHIQVDRLSFAISVRTEFSQINFTVGSNSGPLWKAVLSTVKAVRNCSGNKSPVLRKLRFY